MKSGDASDAGWQGQSLPVDCKRDMVASQPLVADTSQWGMGGGA